MEKSPPEFAKSLKPKLRDSEVPRLLGALTPQCPTPGTSGQNMSNQTQTWASISQRLGVEP